MFNQQSQGVLTPQMVHMQRLMGTRPQRSAFFAPTEIHSSPLDLNDAQQYPLGPTHSPNFDSGLGGPASSSSSSVIRSFPNRVDLDNFSFGQGMLGQQHGGCSINGQIGFGEGAANGGFIGGASARMPMAMFKCPECDIEKNSSEDLEIHIKTEHLGWLPFQCPICTALRASDTQMREHIHSHHKKSEHRYIYVDNPQSKRILQQMMDRSLLGASHQNQQQQRMAPRNRTLNAGAHSGLHGQSMAKKARLNGPESCADPKALPIGKRTNGPLLKSRQNQNDSGGTDKKLPSEMEGVGKEMDAQRQSMIVGQRISSESFGMANSPADNEQSALANGQDEENVAPAAEDNNDQQQQNGAENGGSDRGDQQNTNDQQQQQQREDLLQKRRIGQNRIGPMPSKKRVLGLCIECKKPITAGARQMHMFYHLAKNLGTYRFRCKYSGCNVQHYRKDQMENHQAKFHEKVDAEMMEDRGSELYNLVQETSLKLLGTTDSTPGPTAAKAQLMYDQQMGEMEASIGVRKRRRPADYENNTDHFSSTPNLDKTARHSSAGSGLSSFDSANRRVDTLECRRCNKFILNRIRGFHILWHLSNDLGIVRYGCKYCTFKHDRPQMVRMHGEREHGDANAVKDLLYMHEREQIAMSKECFGVERLFAKEMRRRHKLERAARFNSLGGSPNSLLDNDENSQQSIESEQIGYCAQQISNLKNPLKGEGVVGRDWTQKEPARNRRNGGRPLGGISRIRGPMSRRARDVMVKLREMSTLLGGAHYLKKRNNDAVPQCAKCGKLVANRLSDHACSHMREDLFRCKHCDYGHCSRETVLRHLKDSHSSNESPSDNRLRYAKEIKDAVRECYPGLYVDAPIPTKEDIEKLRGQIDQLRGQMDSEKDGEHEDGMEDDDTEEGEQQHHGEEEGEESMGDYDEEEHNGIMAEEDELMAELFDDEEVEEDEADEREFGIEEEDEEEEGMMMIDEGEEGEMEEEEQQKKTQEPREVRKKSDKDEEAK